MIAEVHVVKRETYRGLSGENCAIAGVKLAFRTIMIKNNTHINNELLPNAQKAQDSNRTSTVRPPVNKGRLEFHKKKIQHWRCLHWNSNRKHAKDFKSAFGKRHARNNPLKQLILPATVRTSDCFTPRSEIKILNCTVRYNLSGFINKISKTGSVEFIGIGQTGHAIIIHQDRMSFFFLFKNTLRKR